MHVTTKEVDNAGTHVLTSVIESDGPNPICSTDASFVAAVTSVSRTASGGVQMQVSLKIVEPTPAVVTVEPVAPAPTAEEKAAAYLVGKGLSADDATAAVAKFGAASVLSKEQAELAAQLDALVAPKTPE